MPVASHASHPPHRLIGVALMLGAMASLPFIDVFAKLLGQRGMPVLEVVWARVAFGALATLPFALRQTGARGLWPDRPALHALRAVLLMLSTFVFFKALSYLPIADALAIFFVQPLILTVLSALILRERVGLRRWGAVAVGFAGTLIIIRPGFQVLNAGVPLALAAGFFLAVYFMITRRMAGSAPAMVTTFQTNLIGTILLSLALPLFWQAPTAVEWAMLAALGVIAIFGHYLITRAYDFAEASLLAPLAYTEMIVATAVGWWFFNDFPDGWTFVGVAILMGCALFISLMESGDRG